MKLYEFFNVPVDKKDRKFPDYGKSKTEEEKAKMADELFWYIIDNDTIHKEHVLPFVKELKKQITSPDFNKNRFTKSWMPAVNKGCRLFYKHHKLTDNPAKLFDEDFKNEVCERLCDKFIEDVKEDQYQVGDHTK